MTFKARVGAVAAFGFTERQAKFLVTVMTHSGVCVMRQYCAYAGISYGEPARALFQALTTAGFATATSCAHPTARLFHVQHKALYRAIGQADSRLRRPMATRRAVERLIVLDAITCDRSVTWLATEREKFSYFTTRVGVPVPDLPAAVFTATATESDAVPAETVRYFPERMPVGLPVEGDRHVVLFAGAEAQPMAFRQFLESHAALLRHLPAWTLRVAFPRHRRAAVEAYRAAFHEHLLTPVPGAAVDEVRWYFSACRSRRAEFDERYFRAASAFGQPRYRVLYRRWIEEGDHVLQAATSPALAEAVHRGLGQLECVVLPHPYVHFEAPERQDDAGEE